MKTSLHIHSEFTKGNSIIKIKDLIERVKKGNYKNIGLFDSGNLDAVPEFFNLAMKKNLKPIIGNGFYFLPTEDFPETKEKFHLVLLAKNRTGYKNLLKLTELSFKEGFYLKPRINLKLLREHSKGLILLSGGMGGIINKYILSGYYNRLNGLIIEFLKIFKDDFYLELQDNGLSENKELNSELLKISKQFTLPLVATDGAFYLDEKDAKLCNSLRKENGNKALKGKGYYFKSTKEMIGLFSAYKDALSNADIIAQKVNYDFNFKDYNYSLEDSLKNTLNQIEYIEKN